jgi:hypothetical protein
MHPYKYLRKFLERDYFKNLLNFKLGSEELFLSLGSHDFLILFLQTERRTVKVCVKFVDKNPKTL